jgi:hypothetical protein
MPSPSISSALMSYVTGKPLGFGSVVDLASE